MPQPTGIAGVHRTNPIPPTFTPAKDQLLVSMTNSSQAPTNPPSSTTVNSDSNQLHTPSPRTTVGAVDRPDRLSQPN